MPGVFVDRVQRYAVAVVAIGAATAIRVALDPVLGVRFPFATLFFAILVVAWHGGFGPALLATGLGVAASVQYLLPRLEQFSLSDTDAAGLLFYLCVGLGIALLGGAMRQAKKTADERHRDAQVEVLSRRQVEDELRLSEQRFRSLVEATTSIVWVCDATGQLLGEQQNWQAITGQTPEEYIRYGWLDAVHPEDRAHVRQLWETAVAGPGIYRANYRLWHAASQAYRQFEAKGVPVLNGDGTIREWVGMCIDVEDRHRSEQALREADRKKDEFLATLAHELRNPLAPIRNAALLLQSEIASRAEIEQAGTIIARQAEQMARLLDDLLDVARIARGRVVLRKERVDLAETLRSAVEQSRPLIDRAGHTIDVELPDEPVWLDADRTRLIQVFANLLNNSAKYTAPGGHIQLFAARRQDHVRVEVRDDGIGIAPEQLPQIFEMFSQVTPALDRAQGGLGVGLALVRGMIELHGGSIEARSEGVGRGSTFIIELPILDLAIPADRQSPAVGGQEKPPSMRILVVDDNQDSATTLATLLRLADHEVETAFSGEAALETVASWRPELVLLDIGLPDMNGYDVCRRLRGRPGGKSLLLIALTGWGQDEDRRRAIEAGFDHHFTKPISLQQLNELFVQVASRRTALDQSRV